MKLLITLLMVIGLTACDSSNNNTSSGSGTVNNPAPEETTDDNATEEETENTEEDEAIQSEPIETSGILWKPVSESDGNLVVLLPSSYSNESVAVHSVNTGGTLGSGRYVGRTNGDRPTYRFSRTGAAYPSPCALRVGNTYFYIPDSGTRYG